MHSLFFVFFNPSIAAVTITFSFIGWQFKKKYFELQHILNSFQAVKPLLSAQDVSKKNLRTMATKLKTTMRRTDQQKPGSRQHPFVPFSCDRKWGNPSKNTKLLDVMTPGNCNEGLKQIVVCVMIKKREK
jgi:hypothetical protein